MALSVLSASPSMAEARKQRFFSLLMEYPRHASMPLHASRHLADERQSASLSASSVSSRPSQKHVAPMHPALHFAKQRSPAAAVPVGSSPSLYLDSVTEYGGLKVADGEVVVSTAATAAGYAC